MIKLKYCWDGVKQKSLAHSLCRISAYEAQKAARNIPSEVLLLFREIWKPTWPHGIWLEETFLTFYSKTSSFEVARHTINVPLGVLKKCCSFFFFLSDSKSKMTGRTSDWPKHILIRFFSTKTPCLGLIPRTSTFKKIKRHWPM